MFCYLLLIAGLLLVGKLLGQRATASTQRPSRAAGNPGPWAKALAMGGSVFWGIVQFLGLACLICGGFFTLYLLVVGLAFAFGGPMQF